MSSFFFFKQKTAYEIVVSDWSSDVCSSDLMVFETPDLVFFNPRCSLSLSLSFSLSPFLSLSLPFSLSPFLSLSLSLPFSLSFSFFLSLSLSLPLSLLKCAQLGGVTASWSRPG